jgi:hypothetical protein
MKRTLERGDTSSLYDVFSYAQIIGVIVLAVALSGIARGQSPDSAPDKTTLCELMRSPEQFNGKLVQYRAEYVSKYRWTGFVDDSCAAKIEVGALHVLDTLKPKYGQYAYITNDPSLMHLQDSLEHPERFNWEPITPPLAITLNQDASYGALLKHADAKFRWEDGSGVCPDCPLYRITVSTTGRFDYFPSQSVFVRAGPGGKPYVVGSGDQSVSARVVIQLVSDVEADPISP